MFDHQIIHIKVCNNKFKSRGALDFYGEMVDEIKITLETLYDILRTEKKAEDLQQLEETFYIDVISYLREKKAMLEMKKESDNIFASGEKEKLQYELRSIKRILKQLYEKREKKIIDIALNRSRTGSDIIDTSTMLRQEKDFYEYLLGHLDNYRRGVLMQLFKGELPESAGEKKEIIVEKEIPTSKESSNSDDPTKIRFIHPTPSFVWKDMKVYGPYEPGDEVDIFPEVAALLVRKGRAEKLS